MKTIDITWDEVTPGDNITVWRQPRGQSGQGGTVHSIDAGAVSLIAGTGRFEVVMTRTETHHLTAEVPFDADECLQYDPQRCGGTVELFAPGPGNAFPRCHVHREERARSYETSSERFADSDLPPAGFDPADIGEHWSENDY